MSLNNAKASVIMSVMIIHHFKYLCTGQFIGANRSPLMLNRRMLVYPNNFHIWPNSASTHCCSNVHSDYISRYYYEVNRLKFFKTSTELHVNSRFEDSGNFGQLSPRQTSPAMHRGPPMMSPWRGKQKPVDYNNYYWSGVQNRLLPHTYSNGDLIKNTLNQNQLGHKKYLYISTTEKFIKTDTTEKYLVSVDPKKTVDEVESEEDDFSNNSSSSQPSTSVPIHETRNNEPTTEATEPTVSVFDLLVPISTPPAPYEDEKFNVSTFKSVLNNESLSRDKKLNTVSTPLPDCENENKTVLPLLNDSFPYEVTRRLNPNNDSDILEKFLLALDDLERTFYLSTFTKLSTNSPIEKAENGISFVQSGLLLHIMLTALTMTVDPRTRAEIEACIHFPATEKEKLRALRLAIQWLPTSSKELRFRWSSHLLLAPTVDVTEGFRAGAAADSHLRVQTLNTTNNPELLMNIFNQMIEADSGGAMRDTFDEADLSAGVLTVLLSTMYVRGAWRSAPTLLAGSRPFHDARNPPRPTRMIRINDVVNYADLKTFDAEAVEISYATPGLSLLVLLPRGRSLRALSRRVGGAGVRGLRALMAPRRVAVLMPLYTLRMTLLLPNKLQDMGITRLLSSPDDNSTDSGTLKVSHAVQRLMFWSEAGRNAYKDDGIEWDEEPEMEMVLDRPYIFFIRWRNVTLMNGHFVL